MKKFITFAFASVLSVAAFAQVDEYEDDGYFWNAKDWAKDNQSFNPGQTFEYSESDNTLSVTFKTAEDNGLRRAEIAYRRPVTLGGPSTSAKTIVVFKLKFENANFSNFDKNMIYVRRQLRNTEKEIDTTEYLDPYFITNQSQNAGRAPYYGYYNESGKVETRQDDIRGYYWRYLPSLGFETVSHQSNPDWSKPFVVPSSLNNNVKFTFNDQDTWGYSYVGIRLNHSTDNEDGVPGKLGDNAKATFCYINILSLDDLGMSAAEFTSKSSADMGKIIQKFIDETALNVAGVEDVAVAGADELEIVTSGSTVSATGATLIEAYTMAGVKVAQATDTVELPAGLYVIRATNGAATSTAKVSVK